MTMDDKLGADGDALYAALMQAHDGLTTDQSHAFNARLVLMMMNEIGDADTITALMKQARRLSES
jgi:hypothetical protein